jgi:hypothetical protein
MIKQLISLLEHYPERTNVSQCLEVIYGKDELRYRNGYDDRKSLPLNEAIDIYRTRARINTELNNGIIKGFETLISALENANVQIVRIISLELLTKWYVVFTDNAISELFGILDCPKERDGWFNRKTGYKPVA